MNYAKIYFKDIKVGQYFSLYVDGAEYRKTTSEYDPGIIRKINNAIAVTTGEGIEIEPSRPVYVKFGDDV